MNDDNIVMGKKYRHAETPMDKGNDDNDDHDDNIHTFRKRRPDKIRI
jgi:hypothetical protein